MHAYNNRIYEGEMCKYAWLVYALASTSGNLDQY